MTARRVAFVDNNTDLFLACVKVRIVFLCILCTMHSLLTIQAAQLRRTYDHACSRIRRIRR